MVIASYDKGKLKVIERSREMVRLAAGLTANGKISRKVSKRALNCLERFAGHLQKEHAVK
ncbi:MAG: exopolyphosphatase, partial [Gammaproteobacteria bacterium]|nr:exopolyphosphatase [Gammaproteobacteria bacterium]